MSYILTEKNSEIIEKYFDAFDLELISDIKDCNYKYCQQPTTLKGLGLST